MQEKQFIIKYIKRKYSYIIMNNKAKNNLFWSVSIEACKDYFQLKLGLSTPTDNDDIAEIYLQ